MMVPKQAPYIRTDDSASPKDVGVLMWMDEEAS